jgi:multiple sugar transport system ATP-binding protein
MKDGVMHQVGTPLELYRRPVNRFVASFIGSPAMNFLDVNVACEAETFTLSCQGLRLALPSRAFPNLGSRVGQSVCIGMRPQHIRLGPPANASEVGFKGTVMVSEQLGDEQVLVVRLGATDIRVAGVDPDLKLATGSELEAAIATANLHFFDAE